MMAMMCSALSEVCFFFDARFFRCRWYWLCCAGESLWERGGCIVRAGAFEDCDDSES